MVETSVEHWTLRLRYTRVLCALLWVMFLFALGFHYVAKTADGPYWVVAFLTLPLFVQTIGLLLLHKEARHDQRVIPFFEFYVFWVFVSSLGYILLWLAYSIDLKHDSPAELKRIMSGTAFLWIMWLLWPVGRMGYAIMMPAHRMLGSYAPADSDGIFTRLTNPWVKAWELRLITLKTSAMRCPLWAMVLFFTLFLAITNLFAFGFAFHDKDHWRTAKKPALQSEVPWKGDPGRRTGPYIICFESLSGAVGAACAQNTPSSTNPNQADRLAWRQDSNCKNLTALTDEIVRAFTVPDDLGRSNLPLDEVQIELRGSASDENLSGPVLRPPPIRPGAAYSSNYELSAARIEHVKRTVLAKLSEREISDGNALAKQRMAAPSEPEKEEIDKQLYDLPEKTRRWRDIRWLSMPLSIELPSEEVAILRGNEQYLEPGGNKRVVVASLTQLPSRQTASMPKHLDLIDYEYFTIYTITTTGYGDIVPQTTYAKFLTSFANICEVLFLVVFFSTLISLKGEIDRPYRILCSSNIEGHITKFKRKRQIAVLFNIERQLSFEPTQQKADRNRMREGDALNLWELRIGTMRAYYEVNYEDEPSVCILAVGRKRNSNKVRIGETDIDLGNNPDNEAHDLTGEPLFKELIENSRNKQGSFMSADDLRLRLGIRG